MINMYIDLKFLLFMLFKDKRHRSMKTLTIIKGTKKLFHSNLIIHNEITMESTQEV